MIVTNMAGSYWCQYISPADVNGSIIFNGVNEMYIATNNLRPTKLPIGLSALGFVEMKDSSEHPDWLFYRKGALEIIEKGPSQYFIEDKPVTYTLEAQMEFDLLDLIPNSNPTRIA